MDVMFSRVSLVRAVLVVHGMPSSTADERATHIAQVLGAWEGPKVELRRELRSLIAVAAQVRGVAFRPFPPARERCSEIADAMVACLAACGLMPLCGASVHP